MSRLKNSVRLTGFLGSDPEVKVFAETKSMARVSLATHERYRNAEGEWVTDTQWHYLIFWGKHAVFAEQALTKGTEISIEGRLVTRNYTDKEGISRYVTEVVVNETLMIQRRTPPDNPESTGPELPEES